MPQITKEDALVIRAKAKLSHDLKDPNSAQFRDIFISKISWPEAKNRVVCGEYNAKNSFGAYPGFTKFIYTESDWENSDVKEKARHNSLSFDPGDFNNQVLIPKTKVDEEFWPDLIARVCKEI